MDTERLTHWLEKRWSNCQRCLLSAYRQNVVLGDIVDSPLLLIGEAPGRDEDVQGHPFVGRSGQEMRRVALEIGIDLSRDVSIINVLACKPPNNRDPKPEEVKACQSRIWGIIHILQPKAILLVGRVASQLMTRLMVISVLADRGMEVESLTKWRGKEERWRSIVTIHPAFWLRRKGQGWEKKFQQDLSLAARIAQGKKP